MIGKFRADRPGSLFRWRFIPRQTAQHTTNQQTEQGARPGRHQGASGGAAALPQITEQTSRQGTDGGKNHYFEKTMHGSPSPQGRSG